MIRSVVQPEPLSNDYTSVKCLKGFAPIIARLRATMVLTALDRFLQTSITGEDPPWRCFVSTPQLAYKHNISRYVHFAQNMDVCICMFGQYPGAKLEIPMAQIGALELRRISHVIGSIAELNARSLDSCNSNNH